MADAEKRSVEEVAQDTASSLDCDEVKSLVLGPETRNLAVDHPGLPVEHLRQTHHLGDPVLSSSERNRCINVTREDQDANVSGNQVVVDWQHVRNVVVVVLVDLLVTDRPLNVGLNVNGGLDSSGVQPQIGLVGVGAGDVHLSAEVDQLVSILTVADNAGALVVAVVVDIININNAIEHLCDLVLELIALGLVFGLRIVAELLDLLLGAHRIQSMAVHEREQVVLHLGGSGVGHTVSNEHTAQGDI